MAWFCLVLFVRIGTYQWVSNKNFLLAVRLAAKAPPSISDGCEDVGDFRFFARWEIAKLLPILNPAWSSAVASVEPEKHGGEKNSAPSDFLRTIAKPWPSTLAAAVQGIPCATSSG
jgi:hypothetical protein